MRRQREESVPASANDAPCTAHWEEICLSLDESACFLLQGHKGRVFDASFGEVVVPCVGAAPTPVAAIATACEDGKVRIWEVHTQRLIKTLKGHNSEATRVAWHKRADQTSTAMLASSGTEGETIIWDAGMGQVQTLRHDKEQQLYVCEWGPAWSCIADKLVTGADQNLHIWDINTA